MRGKGAGQGRVLCEDSQPLQGFVAISQDRSPLACHEHFPRPEVQVAKTPAEAFQDCLQSQNKYCHAGHKKGTG
jgi:hypothetical protein